VRTENQAPRPLPIVLGPTAAGKSALALELAEALGGEIVSADALQVYRGFDVGTAKPSPEEQRRVRHHLIDVLDPDEAYSAGEFARRARAAIGEIEARGRVPLVAGGSGLYLRALTEGISPVPRSDPEVRVGLRRRLEAEGLAPLAAELARLDPETASRLGSGDTQRVLRALEVAVTSGRPLSRWIAGQPFGAERVPAVKIGLTLPRAILYDRITRRAVRMVERGWVEEVEGLLQQGYRPDAPAFQAIGYRQIAAHVLGERSLASALEETIRETRRFAKRQLTWFRREPGVEWHDALDLAGRIPHLIDSLERRGFWRRHG
jgi:tRNA dimethylallyltransferase